MPTNAKPKRPKKTSPTQRTLAWLRKQGYTCGITEKWNQFAKVRQDLLGFIDLVAVGCFDSFDRSGIWGVQTTSSDNLSSRRHKIEASAEAVTWCKAGGRILLVGWAQRGPMGKVKRWTANAVEMFYDCTEAAWKEKAFDPVLPPD